jgi:hypothetical protein
MGQVRLRVFALVRSARGFQEVHYQYIQPIVSQHAYELRHLCPNRIRSGGDVEQVRIASKSATP